MCLHVIPSAREDPRPGRRNHGRRRLGIPGTRANPLGPAPSLGVCRVWRRCSHPYHHLALKRGAEGNVARHFPSPFLFVTAAAPYPASARPIRDRHGWGWGHADAPPPVLPRSRRAPADALRRRRRDDGGDAGGSHHGWAEVVALPCPRSSPDHARRRSMAFPRPASPRERERRRFLDSGLDLFSAFKRQCTSDNELS